MEINVYVGITGINDAVGRADYISNSNRQENLLAVAGKTDVEFWKHLSEDAQEAWLHSGGIREKTVQRKNKETGEMEEVVVRKKASEAREIMVILPKDVLELNVEEQKKIAEEFVEFLKEKYGIECIAGLHESETENNVHIHAMFSERQLLPEPEIKIADRNVFLDENGIRKRTKKEILDSEGNIRAGCKIVPKGSVISKRYFGNKEELFFSKDWAADCKKDIAEWINERLQPDKKRVVFDPDGPFLAQKKIGKGNSELHKKYEQRVRIENEMVKTFNRMAREGVMSEEEAKREKTVIMLAPNRFQALATCLASFTSEKAAEILQDSPLRNLSNEQLDQVERSSGTPRTKTGVNEEKKRKLREYYRLAALARQQARNTGNTTEERQENWALARQYSARIDQLRKELGYVKAVEYRRMQEEKEEALRRKRYQVYSCRSRITKYRGWKQSKIDYILYLNREIDKLPVFFQTRADRERRLELETKMSQAKDELNAIYEYEARARAQQKQAKLELKEMKKEIRQLKKEAAAQRKEEKMAEKKKGLDSLISSAEHRKGVEYPEKKQQDRQKKYSKPEKKEDEMSF